ncbi:MAG: hypothetical protein H0U85_04785 [Gemmatimonadales bacterium]|nr:hypothetical protein [Gemmatimonadales bacterium]
MTRPGVAAGCAALALIASTLPACSRRDNPAIRTVRADGAATPADSLVVAGSGGVAVWFTLAREDHDTNGTVCTDRAIEIRRGASRVAVPLLYTQATPRIIDDSTVEAVLYRACHPVDRYRVDIRTGQPTPVRGG